MVDIKFWRIFYNLIINFLLYFRIYILVIMRNTDTAKLTGPWTLADKRWVGPVKLLCIIMFDISKIRPKSILGPVKAQKFSRCLEIQSECSHCVLKVALGPLLLTIPAWISNHIHYEMWDELTYRYPLPNFNGCTVEVWELISSFILHFTVQVITYPCVN